MHRYILLAMVYLWYIYGLCVHVIVMQCNGQHISWAHLEILYKKDTGSGADPVGLRLVPKLKYEHIYLSSFANMRIDLAAQVCVCNAVHVLWFL